MLHIGIHSEEDSEVRNKDVKYIRQLKTRKIPRWHTMHKLIHKLFVPLDLFIAS